MSNETEPIKQLSIVIPAYNEGKNIAGTLESIYEAIPLAGIPVEVIVVDNDSSDDTADICRKAMDTMPNLKLHFEKKHSIGAARNSGARESTGDYILFLDADVRISRYSLLALADHVRSRCTRLGGMTAIYYPQKLTSWLICAYWDRRRHVQGGAPQGVSQFVQRDVFEAVGGYDEDMRMSEDVDFYKRAKAYLAEVSDGTSKPCIIKDSIAWPDPRRYDKTSAVKQLWMNNPIVAGAATKNKRFWKSWREKTVR